MFFILTLSFLGCIFKMILVDHWSGEKKILFLLMIFYAINFEIFHTFFILLLCFLHQFNLFFISLINKALDLTISTAKSAFLIVHFLHNDSWLWLFNFFDILSNKTIFSFSIYLSNNFTMMWTIGSAYGTGTISAAVSIALRSHHIEFAHSHEGVLIDEMFVFFFDDEVTLIDLDEFFLMRLFFYLYEVF